MVDGRYGCTTRRQHPFDRDTLLPSVRTLSSTPGPSSVPGPSPSSTQLGTPRVHDLYARYERLTYVYSPFFYRCVESAFFSGRFLYFNPTLVPTLLPLSRFSFPRRVGSWFEGPLVPDVSGPTLESLVVLSVCEWKNLRTMVKHLL